MPLSGFVKPFKRVSLGIKDPELAVAVRQLEDKIDEMDKRLIELERRVTAGGL